MLKISGEIAVVGMAGVFPQAMNTRQFINNIIGKKDSVITVPDNRWIGPVSDFVSPQTLPDKAISNKAGLIENFHFDPDGFPVDKDFLSDLDPLHQLVLHAGREAFSHCYHTKENKKRTGVMLAAIALPTDASSRFSWQVICHHNKKYTTPSPKDFSSAAVVSFPAAVLARAMRFEGGSFTLDAACASSLYAIKLACEHLSLKKADIMLAGGVSRPDALYTQIGFSQLQALSPSGRCAPFDRTADGLVVGEGTGIVVLKRLGDAIACGDTIHGIIQGVGVSNDIDGTLVGPASEGQVRAMTQAYKKASWSPLDIQYMECHGSGTPVGDQVELSSIQSLLSAFDCPDTHLSIGSVKSMTGHLLTAAGAAGFIKTLLSMNKKILPPSLNFTAPASGSLLTRSNIKVQTRVEAWQPKTLNATRKAGISAFGFGGINAHLLVEEFKGTATRIIVKNIDKKKQLKKVPCAIIGMETIAKACPSLSRFKDLLFDETSVTPGLPKSRWLRNNHPGIEARPGFFMDHFSTSVGEFHIPPNQMADILPQQILFLKTAKRALENANITPRPMETESRRYHMGCAVGIEFDYGATNFHLRWKINHLDETLKDRISPSLTFNRTLGALGGIVASRVAREFKFGGPCFTLSAGAASGIKAIEAGVHSLSSGETDIFLCGCVDLAGDIRQFALNDIAKPHTGDILPSEGAAAIVLKRLDQAMADNDRIYGVVTGIAGKSSDTLPGEAQMDPSRSNRLYALSLETALKDSNSVFDEIDLYETGSTGVKKNDETETAVLNRFCKACVDQTPCHITSTSTRIGNTRGASALFSVIATALFLYYQPSHLKTPIKKACVASITLDGSFSHAILENYKQGNKKKDPMLVPKNRSQKNLRIKTNPRPISNKTIQEIYGYLAANGIGFSHTATAHEKFLEFSKKNMQVLEKQFETLTRLAGNVLEKMDKPATVPVKRPLLDREDCLEYAVGKAGNVLGKEFEIIDTYPVRVRLPDEPLMLVDRIMDIQGERLSLSSGKIITQHDVKKNAWYLDGGKAPVSISIEAGQADLFLCAFLGIDHVVKGTRKYRLLDARVTFHRSLPEPGETIEYHIEIDRFLKQGDVYLFFFHYNGFINDRLLISMRDGCAGFFTEQEVENSGGIVLKTKALKQMPSHQTFSPFVPVEKQGFSDEKIEALRKGDLGSAFGGNFYYKPLGKHLKLPGGRMHLIDRVLEFDPTGGKFGLGSIIAQTDIHPDDWFLTCHFIDDRVMPGTLMYECCAHALRIFTQRMGWVSDRDDVFYDIVPGNESDLKCRGPVTPGTKKARYEIEIKELGYAPEPYVIADAHMFSDDLRIVLYKNMGMKIAGLTLNDLKSFWRNQ